MGTTNKSWSDQTVSINLTVSQKEKKNQEYLQEYKSIQHPKNQNLRLTVKCEGHERHEKKQESTAHEEKKR